MRRRFQKENKGGQFYILGENKGGQFYILDRDGGRPNIFSASDEKPPRLTKSLATKKSEDSDRSSFLTHGNIL